MSITVIDSATGIRRVLDAAPDRRPDLVRALWEPMSGMYRHAPVPVDLHTAHQQSFGFPTEHSAAEVAEGLDALRSAGAWTRVESALQEGVDALRAANLGLAVGDLTVLILLGDPTNDHFMHEAQGLSGFGGISGYIALTLWPTPRVLDRLEAIAVHELHHNLRYGPGGVVWDPQTVTVGEHVVSEGLADVFAAELHSEAGYTHFVSERTRTDDAVLAKVASGLGITGMGDFAAWVLGDPSARLFGATPVGLPTGAGYAVGARIVHAYAEATGTTAAAALHTPAQDILAVALPRLGLT